MKVQVHGRVLVVGYVGGIGAILELLAKMGAVHANVGTVHGAQQHLRDNPETDLVLLAPGLSDTSQHELCRTIKFDQRTSLMPVVVVRPVGMERRVAECYEAGADDCLMLDAPERELEARLAKLMQMKRITDSLEDAKAVILSLAKAIEGKDEYTCGHVERVGAYSVEIGKRVGLDAEGLAALRTGGVVHDIGKIGIPDGILNKTGKLTDEERMIMQRHPVIGYDILKPMRTFRAVLPIVRWHHERPNGTGYPDGLSGPEVPLLARITSVADVFDALSTNRPYRKALPREECEKIMVAEAKAGKLDEDLVRVLMKALVEGSAGGGVAREAAV